jgi:hypothetical protein
MNEMHVPPFLPNKLRMICRSKMGHLATRMRYVKVRPGQKQIAAAR